MMTRRSLALCAAALLLLAGCTTSSPRRTLTAPSPATPGATSVTSYGADPSGAKDSTPAFVKAQTAALATKTRYAGPAGPQAVVYVPPGTYRLLHFAQASNVRLEVDAAAVLEQAGGRNTGGSGNPPSLIDWDGPQGHPLANVSIVGVGQANTPLKSKAGTPFPGWSLAGDFTFDLDPATTDANDLVTGLQALNVKGFLIANVYSIENNTQPKVAAKTDAAWWPQSRKAALGLRERADTPVGGPYADPTDGTVSNWYNVGGPKGFGPNQINAGHNLTFTHLFSEGGTTLRMETDASLGKHFGSELRGVHATDIAGQDCNRVVSFAPHDQANSDVHVSNVRSVGCAEGIQESVDGTGSFTDSTVDHVSVTAGPHAQVGNPSTNGIWTVGPSYQAFSKDSPNRSKWSVVYTAGTLTCTGKFTAPSAPIATTDGRQQPKCSP